MSEHMSEEEKHQHIERAYADLRLATSNLIEAAVALNKFGMDVPILTPHVLGHFLKVITDLDTASAFIHSFLRFSFLKGMVPKRPDEPFRPGGVS